MENEDFYTFLRWWIGILIGATIMGIITHIIGKGKGRNESFYFGFFLGIIGILVVACLPNKNINNNIPNSNKYDDLAKIQKLKESGVLSIEQFEKEKQKILNI